MVSNLVRDFDRAGLRLELPRLPIVRINPDIFQMDIRQDRGREWFRLWHGHEVNQVGVSDSDRNRRQVVLMVREEGRTFTQRLSKRRWTRAAIQPLLAANRARLLRETANDWVVDRGASASLRRFLCGRDESRLFIAEFAGGTTVRDAHQRLKPAAVRESERSRAGAVMRQGEWFFIPLTPVEARFLEQELETRPWVLRRREPLGPGGRPHVADEALRLEWNRLYARGAVRHPDHKTQVLGEWRRVHHNAEVPRELSDENGIYGCD